MDFVFCDSTVLECWLAEQVARSTKRTLSLEQGQKIVEVAQALESLVSSKRLRLSCTVWTAAHLVTQYYKSKPPFLGETGGFPLRKSWAREAAEVLHESVRLLSATDREFQHASELFWAYCDRGDKQAYAGFMDYVDASLIMAAPDQSRIAHVCIGHPHVAYILNRANYRQCRIHHFSV